ncbi:hypothetical protein [Brevibacillus laterosporus]|uniref:Uncharacterized protein n=1 Tax=Brevibacillus laterosporus TaxID=1465 RepID=A0AAP3DKR5_BRELA|nr:hypothetical protein [Brevibacillus laterosporus]MCR8982970.1 hypothetical protein [Brevibacillus laterosporus]MCZ0810126.1 hypothetical protein [Brevibacillus laterosporus]MCZ0828752.1 hypothetical protein [Brevibacillus laterosporus]MCZ0852755.1 hypothetical protein [Brevibacillus laterosporus]
MNLSIPDELQPIAEELQRHMSPHVLEHLAKEKGFIQRKRPVNGPKRAIMEVT